MNICPICNIRYEEETKACICGYRFGTPIQPKGKNSILFANAEGVSNTFKILAKPYDVTHKLIVMLQKYNSDEVATLQFDTSTGKLDVKCNIDLTDAAQAFVENVIKFYNGEKFKDEQTIDMFEG